MSHHQGTVVLVSRGLSRPIRATLGAAAPTISRGYSRYGTIERPKRKSAIEWQGMESFQMTLNIMFDKFRDQQSVEAECVAIEALAVSRGGNQAQPPQLTVFGPVPHANLRWLITSIDWGPVIYHENGYRVRQELTLTLDENVQANKIVGKDRKTNKVRYRVVVVKRGYDLRQIAATTMGDSALWRRITNMKGQKFRDPYVKPNTRVKVPIT